MPWACGYALAKEERVAKKKRILVACGTGMATSTAAAESLREALEDQGISVEINQCKFSELKSYVDSFEPHVIVATGKLSDDFGVPVFSGQPFLTGIGEEEVVDDIAQAIR